MRRIRWEEETNLVEIRGRKVIPVPLNRSYLILGGNLLITLEEKGSQVEVQNKNDHWIRATRRDFPYSLHYLIVVRRTHKFSWAGKVEIVKSCPNPKGGTDYLLQVQTGEFEIETDRVRRFFVYRLGNTIKRVFRKGVYNG